MHSAAASLIELHVDNCLHVSAKGGRPCTMLLTSAHLILEHEGSSPKGFFDGKILAAAEEAGKPNVSVGSRREEVQEKTTQMKNIRRQLSDKRRLPR